MTQKKRFCIFLVLLLVLIPVSSLADFDVSSVPTPNMIVVDASDTGKVFYEKNADARIFPASTTKIMTCILALESGRLDDQVTVGNEVLDGFTKYSSLLYGTEFMQVGETLTLRDLVYGLMLVSGNDAAAAIAVHVGGSIEGFASLMNSKAAALGMTSTHYMNPHGTHNDSHYTTARDMAKLTAYALQNESFVELTKTVSYTIPANNLHTTPYTLYTSNKLLRKPDADTESYVYEYAIGVKTGDTTKAGKCLVAAAEKDGARVIAILMGNTAEMYGGDSALAGNARFATAKTIFEDVFQNQYVRVNAGDLALEKTFQVAVTNGRAEDLTGGALEATANLSGFSFLTPTSVANQLKSNPSAISAVFEPVANLTAPIPAGMYLGKVHYVYNGKTVFSADLTAAREVRADGASVGISTSDPLISTGDPLVSSTPGETPAKRSVNPWVYVVIFLIVVLVVLMILFIIAEKRRQDRIRAKRRRQRMLQKQREQQMQRERYRE